VETVETRPGFVIGVIGSDDLVQPRSEEMEWIMASRITVDISHYAVSG